MRLSLTAAMVFPSASVCAQALDFGSSDDPREAMTRTTWRVPSYLHGYGGLSLIGTELRSAFSGTFELNTYALSARLNGTVRAGYYGLYERDFDEWYDAVRLVEFIRFRPETHVPFHLRAGTIERGRLGTGHLVNFYRSSVAHNQRTVGAEAAVQLPAVEAGAFTDDILLNRVIGASASVTPFYWAPGTRMRSLRIAANHARDLGLELDGGNALAAYSLESSIIALGFEDIFLAPFLSYAWYDRLGDGFSMGVEFASGNLIDIGRFRFRLAIDYYSQQFIPGYFNSFYRINNIRDRVWDSERYISDRGNERFVGTPIHESLGGSSITHEIRLLLFEQAELWHYFRRHYGTQRLSEYHLHLFLYPRGPDRLRFDLVLHRGEMQRFTDLFRTAGDLNALTFNFDYRIAGPVWMSIRTQYGYRRVADGPDGERRFLVERRFEPLIGVRMAF